MVKRRYSHFLQWYITLSQGEWLPQMPPKSHFRKRLCRDFMKQRLSGLNAVLQEIMECSCVDVAAFLGQAVGNLVRASTGSSAGSSRASVTASSVVQLADRTFIGSSGASVALPSMGMHAGDASPPYNLSRAEVHTGFLFQIFSDHAVHLEAYGANISDSAAARWPHGRLRSRPARREAWAAEPGQPATFTMDEKTKRQNYAIHSIWDKWYFLNGDLTLPAIQGNWHWQEYSVDEEKLFSRAFHARDADRGSCLARFGPGDRYQLWLADAPITLRNMHAIESGLAIGSDGCEVLAGLSTDFWQFER